MLLLLLDALRWLLRTESGAADLGPLRVFQYISVRAGSALVVAFVVSLAAGPWMIARLSRLGARQVVRRAQSQGAISLHGMHGQKEGTPTMGGVLILLALALAVMLFARLDNPYALLLLAVSVGFGALGFWDDYAKVRRQNHLGVSPRLKLAIQGLIGVVLGLTLCLGAWPVRYELTGAQGYAYLMVPFFKQAYPSLGIGFVVLTAIVLMGTSNAVNLTDGLDGLAIGVTLASAMAFTVMAYLASRPDYSAYLYIPYVPGGGEIVVFGGAIIGASIGFLWFNAHPAQVFMGDTGSMMLGGALGTMALLIKQELLLILIGGVFVAEALSVILQVGSFRLRGRRVLRMSPLHHHFEKLGLHENKIIIRFWAIALMLALFGLATLKLR